jgi:hypothetical protein
MKDKRKDRLSERRLIDFWMKRNKTNGEPDGQMIDVLLGKMNKRYFIFSAIVLLFCI